MLTKQTSHAIYSIPTLKMVISCVRATQLLDVIVECEKYGLDKKL